MRLLRKLCDNCKQPYAPTPQILQQLGILLRQEPVDIGERQQLFDVDADESDLSADVGLKLARFAGKADIAVDSQKPLPDLRGAPLDFIGLAKNLVGIVSILLRLQKCPGTQDQRDAQPDIGKDSKDAAGLERH